MQIVLSSEAKQHLLYWKKSGNNSILNKIDKLTDSILETPYTGIVKPEALKYELANKWSRRINK
jgi:toxin YoeB